MYIYIYIYIYICIYIFNVIISFLLKIITFSAFYYVTQLSIYFISTVKMLKVKAAVYNLSTTEGTATRRTVILISK